MKNLTLKALFVSAIAAMTMNVQAADDVYGQCIADAENVIATAKKDGSTAAQALEQKTDVATCMAELAKIEAKYGDKTVGLNPSSVMTPEDRAAWSKLFDAIDAKQFKGVPFLQASYYR
jgi:ABC-type transporter MlaC component